MANEIGIQLLAAPSLGTPYVFIRNSINEIWDVINEQFTGYTSVNIDDYDLPMSQQGTSKYYTVSMPTHVNMVPGVYTIQYFDGGVPSEADTVVGVDNNFEWNSGSEVNPNIVYMELSFNIDDPNALDEYAAIFKINGFELGASAFTGSDPDIRVGDKVDADLIPQTVMTQVGATQRFKYDAAGAERITDGSSYFVTIDVELFGVILQFTETVSRDD